MPNWCSNNITVKGQGKYVKEFIQDNFKTNKNPYDSNSKEYDYILDFEQFDPTPLDDAGEVFSEWYTWRLEHWGCKWSPSYEQQVYLMIEKEGEEPIQIFNEGHHLHEENQTFNEEFVKNLDTDCNMTLEINCYCETPWGPPDSIFRRWAEKYSEHLEASLKFYEPGCTIMGEFMFKGNEYEEYYANYYNRAEWILYALEEGWETTEWYIDECMDMIAEMHDKKEEIEAIMNKVSDVLKVCNNKQASSLIADITNKYFEWLHEPKEEEDNE
jgi:hypothetical protein